MTGGSSMGEVRSGASTARLRPAASLRRPARPRPPVHLPDPAARLPAAPPVPVVTMFVVALLGTGADHRDPAGHQGDHRRPDRRPRRRAASCRSACSRSALGVARGGADLRAPLGAVQRACSASRPRSADDLYARLQELPMSFHGQWQSGQLLSRATTDLSSDPPVLRLRPAVPASSTSCRSSWSTLVLLQHVLAARPGGRGRRRCRSSGCRMRFEKALRRGLPPRPGPAGRPRHAGRGGRGRHPGDQVLRPQPATSPAVRRRPRARSTSTSMEKVRLSAKFWTFLEMIPNLAVVVVLLLGAIGVGRGALTPGELVAFITLMLSLVWPVASLGVILAMAQEAMTAAARVARDLRHRARHRRPATRRARAAARPPALRGRRLHLPRRPTQPVLRDVNLDVAPGETRRARRRHRLRQDRR